MRKPKVSIVIVNYNRKKLLENCLESVFNLNYPKTKLEVIVVDNNSSDGSIEYIKKEFDNVKLIKNKENNYCKANNLGIKKANGAYIAFVNNDVKLKENWLIELIKHLEDNTDIAGAMGKVLFKDGLIQSTGHYELPNFYWGDRGFKEKDKGQFEKIEEVKSIPNIASLYRRNVFDKVGFFDKDFQMYIEDIDMGIRCRKKGLNFLYIPNAICYHEFHGTADEDFLLHKIEKNRLLFITKHFPDKLPEALYGKGYFSLKLGKLYEILPKIFDKLMSSLYSKEMLLENLSQIFNEIKRIETHDLNYLRKRELYLNDKVKDLEESLKEKTQQISRINKSLVRKNEIINKLEKMLSYKDQKLQDAYVSLGGKKEIIDRLDSMLDSIKNKVLTKDKKINKLENLIIAKDAKIVETEEKNLQLNKILEQRKKHAEELQNNFNNIKKEWDKWGDWIDRFWHSRTYRYFLRYFWGILSFFKKIKRLKRFLHFNFYVKKIRLFTGFFLNKEPDLSIAYFHTNFSKFKIKKNIDYFLKLTNNILKKRRVNIFIVIKNCENKKRHFISRGFVILPSKNSVEIKFSFDWYKKIEFYNKKDENSCMLNIKSNFMRKISPGLYSISVTLLDNYNRAKDNVKLFNKIEL